MMQNLQKAGSTENLLPKTKENPSGAAFPGAHRTLKSKPPFSWQENGGEKDLALRDLCLLTY